jgi:IS1 family transposase
LRAIVSYTFWAISGVDSIVTIVPFLRTRIKRLIRQAICFFKSIEMYGIVIGLFVNRYGLELSA